MSTATTIQGYRISPEQSRLWLLQQQSSAYVALAAIGIEGPIDIARLEAALAGIVNRLEILRTTFRLQAGMRTPLQVITDLEQSSCLRVDWTGYSRSQVDAALDALLAEQRKRPVNLDTGPVLELWLASVSAHEHYLILRLPSLCADSASLNNLFEEVVSAYGGDQSDDQSEELLQYADFAEWHYGLLDEDAQSAAKTYWREQRLSFSSLSTIRRVRKSASHRAFDVAITTLAVDRETASAAESIARDKSIPVSDVYLACWQTLIWRLSGEPDVAIGAVADDRGHETLRNACGLYSITLPVRHHFDDRMRFDEVVDAVARSRRVASDRQYEFSWERDVEDSGSNREPGFFPLAFQFQARPSRRNARSASFSVVRSFACTDRFHVKLNCVQDGGAVSLEWHCDPNVLSTEEIERLSRHYQAIVKSAVETPRAATLDLEMLDDAQRQQLLVGFNDSVARYSIDVCVHERFEEVARRDPDRPAVVYEQQVLSYGELNARSNQLAHRLRSLGVGPDARVGLCVERSPDMILGILGIIKAGGAYVPLDHSLPSSRLTLLIEESRASVVVCQQHLTELFSESDATCVVLNDDPSSGISRESRENCSSGVTPANLVYTLFTSGSTGTPKGVLIEHRQLVNYVDGVRHRLQLPQDASFATVSSFAADLGNTAIFPALLSGGCLHIVSQERVMDPAAMAEYGERHRIDCLKIVPSHLAALLSAPHPERVLSRQRLVLGGEASTWELVNRVETLSSDCQILNHYGPTETTVGVLTYGHERGRLRADESDTLPLGRPLGNSQIFLLDSRGRPVPIGVSGELHIAGAGLGRGYVNRPDQTAAGFVPNPFSSEPGARMYRTGDVARYLTDGNVEFLGRADHQVKIRGFRVELGEIESVLSRHGSIESAIVLAREDVPGDKRLVGYVVRQRDARVTADEVRDYVRARLPEYMVPSAIAFLDRLPLNRNGKVDRGALPAIVLAPEARDSAGVPPRTASEEKLIAIWSEVLGNRSLGIHDDFFESGGHSLLAMRLIVGVREAFQVDLPLPALFDTPTIAGLAETIEALIGAGGSDSAPVIEPVPRNQRLPLSFAQQRLWFLDQLEPHSTAYNRSFAVHLTGPLNLESLQQSLRETSRRHEILRTTYPTVDGEAHQIVTPTAGLPLRLIDLGALPVHERGDTARRFVTAEARRPFDLASGPLVRACVIRLDDAQHVLVLSQHHINTDAWSNAVVAHEVSTGYEAFSNGVPSPLTELPIQYADFAAWQREWLAGETLEDQLSFWKEELKGAPPALELPTDRPRPAVQTFRGATRTIGLPKHLVDALKDLSHQEGATLFMTLLAAFQTLLHRYTGQPDILVGSPIAGRMRPEVQGLIGFFVNTLVLRADMRGTPRFSDLLKQVRNRSLAAYANQDLPFERLVDELGLERDLSRTPLFQVMFVLQTDALESLRLPEIRVSQLETPIENAKFNLTLYMAETEQGLNGSLEYDTDLFEASTIDRMLEHFAILLEGIVADPQCPVSALPLLSERERRQLLVEWNDTRAAYPQSETLHGLIELQVERSPDSIAVVFEDQVWTYSALDRWANQLARRLTVLGVKPNVPVGLFMERGPAMVAAILGILKAGGAYVPLPRDYPRERLKFMLNDCGATLLLTQDHLKNELPADTVTVEYVDRDGLQDAIGATRPRPAVAVTASDLAYVIYTSGSTGLPKGTMIEHGGVVNYLAWCIQAYPVVEGSGSPVQSSIGFDATVTSLISPLITGRRVVLLPEAQEIDALAASLSSDSDFGLVKLTPAHLKMLVSMVPEATAQGGTRSFIIGGEALMSDDIEFWRTHAPRTRLVNEYGPTETVVGCCVYEVSRDTPTSGAVPIGRPIANTQLYVLGRHMDPMPVGVPGELYIGGAGLSRGYLNRPELSAERFVPNPFSGDVGARLYKTGDLVRHGADGNLHFLDRIDQQVKVRGFRIELGEIESVLRRYSGVRDAVVLTNDDPARGKRLVAYVASDSRTRPSDVELRSHLQKHLPAHMVPAVFVMLDALPLTPNGKVDRRVLPAPEQARPELEEGFVPARNRVEQILVSIWCQVLGMEQIGVRDRFFELGGDSILSIQVVSRAKRAGLHLTARQIFEHQTVAELAAVAGTAPAIEADQGLVTGAAPLTAIQQWFFEQAFVDSHHFNQSVLLETRSALDPEWLRSAVDALLVHHDALRFRFARHDGRWQQEDSAAASAEAFSRIDLSGFEDAEQRAALESMAAGIQASLALDAGPQLRVGLFDLGKQGQRLLLVAHHLVVDGVSWRILLEDLQTAYDQVSRGEAIHLPRKTTSYAQWARRCNELACSDALQGELSHWESVCHSAVGRLPADDPHGVNTVASARSVTVALTAAETEALLREVPDVYRTHIDDVLLTAVTQAFADWTGEASLLIDLEGHGREDLFPDLDVSRTVGWFTAMYPVVLERTSGEGPGALLKSIKEQLRNVPRRGVGYGLLRYLRDDSRGRLADGPRAPVTFNYLGQVDQALSTSSGFGWASESYGSPQSPNATRSHVLDVRAIVSDRCLRVSFQYSQNIHRRDTVERLGRGFLASLRSLITHCQSPEAGGFTPSDFGLARLTQSEIDRHFRNDRSVEDVYPLSPLQEGMLFHCLHAPNSGAYVTHLVLKLGGALDVEAFQRAWDHVIARHTSLRTGFLWDQISESVQVVRRHANVSWSEEDWRGADDNKRTQDLRAFLNKDRILGFDLSKAPLIRLALIRIAEDAYYFVWTHHHMVMDGWSAPLVLQEVLSFYKALLDGTDATLEPARPYRDYIAWLERQDRRKAESYWRKRLAGLEAPTSLGLARANEVGTRQELGAYEIGNAEYQSRMPAAFTGTLRAFAREHDLTVNTVAQGAWALLLSAYSGEEDVVYGAALSGRPPSLSDVSRIAGMFINTLPARVTIDPHVSVRRWLRRLQAELVELREYEYSALSQVHGWSQIPRSVPLFDVIVSFQNFPVDRTLIDDAARYGLGIELVLSQEQSTAPLTVFFTLEEEFGVRFAYDPSRFDAHTIAGLAERYLGILESMVASGEAAVMDLQIDSDSEAPRLPTMAIQPPSAEELQLLDSLGSWIDDTETDASDRTD
jgi:amino acid adenylation domain-containing protein/non-ribosomal peptide synthase protein (TIGR01720 family)